MTAAKDGGNAKTAAQPQKKIIVHYVPYCRLPNGTAFEAIHVGGKPIFLCYDGSKFAVHPEIVIFSDEKYDEVLRPVEDFPYEPYNFTLKEIDALPAKLSADSVERAYETILNTITPYQDTEEWHLQIDSAAVLLSYLQEKVESVPYIAKVGAPESGKTRSLGLVSWLAYRPMMAVDVTPANIYRYYGQDVQAAGTIIHDEIDDGEIDKDKSLLAIYNAGYKYGAKIPRITGEHQEKQSYYNCYGIKWFGGTELPYSKTFRSRCIVQQFMQGIPEKIDIRDEDKELFRNVRKGLLVFRLLKAFDIFEPVNTGLIGRSRELYSPLLAVVQNTKWYGTVLQPLQQLDKERHEEDRESKQAYVARAVIGCWLDAASKELEKEVTGPLDGQLRAIKESIFVSNNAVIANMDLTETTNDKGRKILVNDDIPYSYSHYDVGKIQAENLKGKKGMDWNADNTKKLRGYSYDLKIIRQLYMRYSGTLGTSGTPSGGGVWSKTGENSRSEEVKDDSEKGGNPTQTSVPSVPSVPDLIQCPKPGCPLKLKTVQMVINHSIRAHNGFPVTAELEARGYNV